MQTRRIFLPFALAVLLGGCNGSGSPVAESDHEPAPLLSPPITQMQATSGNFIALLNGDNADSGSQARGVASFRMSADGMSVAYRLVVANIENVTMAHIHVAETPGGAGPPAVWLYPDAPPAQLLPGRSAGVIAEGVITAASLVGPLEGMTIADLAAVIEMNRAYVNVHTDQFPGGEIRGQVR